MDPKLNGATPAQLIAWGWKQASSDGSMITYEYKNGNKIIVNSVTGWGDWTEPAGGSQSVRLSISAASSVSPNPQSPSLSVAPNQVSDAAMSGSQPSSSNNQSGWSPWQSEGDGSGTVARTREVNGKEEVQIKAPGDKNMLDEVIGTKGMVLSRKEVPIAGASTSGSAEGGGSNSSPGDGQIGNETAVTKSNGQSQNLSHTADPTFGSSSRGQDASPGGTIHPTLSAAPIKTTDPTATGLTAPVDKPAAEINRSAAFTGSGSDTAPKPLTLAQNAAINGNSPAQTDASSSGADSYHANVYTAGAPVTNVEQLKNGATLTTTATGAEVETTSAGNSYTVKAAPKPEVQGSIPTVAPTTSQDITKLMAQAELPTQPHSNPTPVVSPNIVTLPTSSPETSPPAGLGGLSVDTNAQRLGGGCFPAGSKVMTPDGPKPIEDINKGDEITIWNLHEQKILSSKVTNKLTHHNEKTIRLETTAGNVTTTPEHRFWTGHDWVTAGKLKPGSTVFEISGNLQQVMKALPGQEETVYNLHVESPEHNYFVEGLLVHNMKMAQ